MGNAPGADELRVRARLRQLVDGPPAVPPAPAVPPMPTRRPRDWLDDILDSTPAPTPAPSGPQPIAEPVYKTKATPEPQPSPQPRARRPARTRQQHAPRQSLLEATARIPRRIRWLIYHATAAGAGWWLGWVDWSTSTASWFAAGHWTAPSAWVLYGLGACVCGLYRRSRTWAWPAAWAAAVPVSSVVLGVLLYAPNS